MRHAAAVLLALIALPAFAQKPWEVRVDLPIAVPVELPAVPTANPFAVALTSPPMYLKTPLQEKFQGTFTAEGAAYVDSTGVCRRARITRAGLPMIGAELQQEVMDTKFTAGQYLGSATATWVPFAVDFHGRIKGGNVLHLQAVPPDPSQPPQPDAPVTLEPDPADLVVPATPIEQLDQAPTVRRFHCRVSGQTWNQKVRLLVEVTPTGSCSRVIFLSVPEGLRDWLLTSLAAWTFTPGKTADGPTTSWLRLDGDIEVNTSGLDADSLRIMRKTTYPKPS